MGRRDLPFVTILSRLSADRFHVARRWVGAALGHQEERSNLDVATGL